MQNAARPPNTLNPGHRPPYETGVIWTVSHKHTARTPLPQQFEWAYIGLPTKRCSHVEGWLARAVD